MQVLASGMRSFECLKGEESVWALAVKKRQEEEEEGGRRRGLGGGWGVRGGVRSCSSSAPLRTKRGSDTGRREEAEEKRRERARDSLPRQSEGVGGGGGTEGGGRASQGPAVGPDPYGAAGSGMNSEWSGWAAGLLESASKPL